ncbi:MAG: hypothetical protein RLW61_04160 [Gammaproteobacteria bacterium]
MSLPHITASTSNASRPSAPEHAARGALLLAGSGVLLAGFHQAFDLSLGLPGHFGVFILAVLVLARASSPLAWAAVIATVGYLAGSAALAGAGGHKLLNLPGYLACAVVLDLAWRLSPALLRRPGLAAAVGGCAFLAKPLVLAALAGVLALDAGALRHGLLLPLFSHAAFGAAGAAIGAILWEGARPR